MVIYRADPSRKEVALLFDDGPNPKVTPKLLEVLKDKQVHANFFLIGVRAEQSPDIVKLIAQNGHEIGNHTYSHFRLTEVLEEKGEAEVRDEIVRGSAAIQKAADLKESDITFFRPPYLGWNEDVAKVAAPLYGNRIMMAGLAVGDYAWGGNNYWDENDTNAITTQSELIIDTWKQRVSNGTLLGFHDSAEPKLPGLKDYETWVNRGLPTLQAIPKIIDNLRARGLVIKKLSDMTLLPETKKPKDYLSGDNSMIDL